MFWRVRPWTTASFLVGLVTLVAGAICWYLFARIGVAALIGSVCATLGAFGALVMGYVAAARREDGLSLLAVILGLVAVLVAIAPLAAMALFFWGLAHSG